MIELNLIENLRGRRKIQLDVPRAV